MTFIIKPLVTEKMTRITDKSSADKTLVTHNKKTGERHNAKESQHAYTFRTGKKKGNKEVSREKTIYTYTKPALTQYGFVVKPEARKQQIKTEVESLYNVTVLSVNTCRYAGKRSSRYTKAGLLKGQKNAFKKAFVTLKEGDKIDFYSNI